MRILLFLFVLEIIVGAETFEEFVQEFGKLYRSNEEYAFRKSVFDRNVKDIALHNSLNKTWTLGIDRFSDLSRDEFAARIKGYKRLETRNYLLDFVSVSFSDQEIPESVDWRSKGVVSDAKIQGHCGDCWSFSTVETLESHLAIQTGKFVDLSEQMLTSCMPNPQQCDGTGGCNGATQTLGFEYIAKHGIVLESEFPYASGSGNVPACKTFNKSSVFVGIKGHMNLPSNDYQSLLQAVAFKGPIAITVDASSWFGYKGGIFDGCSKSEIELNHAVQLVGYGKDSKTNQDYWLVRNSWGTNWGENGYIRLLRQDQEMQNCADSSDMPSDSHGNCGALTKVKACGTCGILYDSSYPISPHFMQ
jgi:cathepsin L